MNQSIVLNGVTYRWPAAPVVVVCIDGGDPLYLEQGLKDGIIPNIDRFMKQGYSSIAQGIVPSFTCPNNLSIVCGAPPAVHGISGNFYFDVDSGAAVVMTGPELLRSGTVLAQFAAAGARVVAITAKDKLRRQLGQGLVPQRGDICFSAERADQCSVAENGIAHVLDLVGMPQPDMYSADLSFFVLEAGVRLLQQRRPDLIYLSLTDYVQHKHAPGDPAANAFYRRLDDYCARLDALGAVLALTADHGMSDKSGADGRPNVLYLQDILDASLGKGRTRVICPITDAFVRHHGALGGFVRIWILDSSLQPERIIAALREIDGIAEVLDRETVCRRFQLPADREADVAVIARADVALGAAQAEHDLSALRAARLRTHGGISEARVPFILNRPLSPPYLQRAAGGLHSYEIFDYALNGCARPDPILLTPGPLTTTAVTKLAMQADWGSWDAAFNELTATVCRDLLHIVHAQQTHVCIPLQGSGTFAVEAALGTLVPRDGKVLVPNNGAYCQRIVKILSYLGRESVVMDFAEHEPVSAERVEAALAADAALSHVALVHCETATGMLNPLASVAAAVQRHGRGLIVDAMSSFGALPIDARELHFDAVIAASGKCLEGVPGMGFVIAQQDALAVAQGRSHSLALDLHEQWTYLQRTGQWRFTPPTQVVAALRAALDQYQQQGGQPQRYRRYRDNCAALLQAMRALGLRSLLDDRHQAPIIVTFHAPADPAYAFSTLYERVRRRGFILYPGKLTRIETFRVGCIGAIDAATMVAAVAAIAEALAQMQVHQRGARSDA